MLGRLTISKVEKFYLISLFPVFIHLKRTPASSLHLFDYAWQSKTYEKFKVYLSPEQKWYLFLSLCDEMQVDLEKELINVSNEVVKLIARGWYGDGSNVVRLRTKVPLEDLKIKNFPLVTLAEYVMQNPSLQRGKKIRDQQKLVSNWYKAKSIKELVDIQKKIFQQMD